MRLNVRCCCDPAKILGTLEVPSGGYQRITIPPRFTVFGDILSPEWFPQDTLEIGEVVLACGRRERAVKSGDRPDEFWDTLASFKRGDRV